jgi:hypothetical protein
MRVTVALFLDVRGSQYEYTEVVEEMRIALLQADAKWR